MSKTIAECFDGLCAFLKCQIKLLTADPLRSVHPPKQVVDFECIDGR